MPLTEIQGFCGPSYLESSVVFDASRSINLFPVPGIATSRSRMALYGRPGLSPTPFITLPASPARGLWAGDNRLFAVGGTHVYELSSGGGIMTDYGSMSGSSGSGPVVLIANGTQLLVQDSSSAKIYNAIAGMPVVFNGAALEYLDGFYIAIAFGASLVGGNPNQINVSALADGTSWNVLDYVIRTGSSDLTTALAVLNGMLWIFGQKSIEIWYNAGDPLFPFARIQGATLNQGLMAPASVVKFENTLLWLGASDRGYVTVYRSTGIQAQRVSTFPIEQIISSFPAAVLPDAWAYGYQENGHTFYVLNLVSQTNVPLQTVVYDMTADAWHERVYAATWPVSFASVPGFASVGPNFVGDGKSGKIYYQGMMYPNDGGTAIAYERIWNMPGTQNQWARYPQMEILADVGTAKMTLFWSDDAGRTYPHSRGPVAGSIGSPTSGPRFDFRQMGRARDRRYKLDITDKDNLIRLIGAYAEVLQ